MKETITFTFYQYDSYGHTTAVSAIAEYTGGKWNFGSQEWKLSIGDTTWKSKIKDISLQRVENLFDERDLNRLLTILQASDIRLLLEAESKKQPEDTHPSTYTLTYTADEKKIMSWSASCGLWHILEAGLLSDIDSFFMHLHGNRGNRSKTFFQASYNIPCKQSTAIRHENGDEKDIWDDVVENTFMELWGERKTNWWEKEPVSIVQNVGELESLLITFRHKCIDWKAELTAEELTSAIQFIECMACKKDVFLVESSNATQEDLLQEFLKTWPFMRLLNISLDEYTSSGSKDTFTYWLEYRLQLLGSIKGGSAYKFGIFSQQHSDNSGTTAGKIGGRLQAEGYSWSSKYGSSPTDAFETIKESILATIQAVREGNLEEIETIDLPPMLKWKIAFLYQMDLSVPIVLPIYSRSFLQKILGSTGTMSELQKKAVKLIKKNEDVFYIARNLNHTHYTKSLL